MFVHSALFYDAIYAWKDYAAAATSSIYLGAGGAGASLAPRLLILDQESSCSGTKESTADIRTWRVAPAWSSCHTPAMVLP